MINSLYTPSLTASENENNSYHQSFGLPFRNNPPLCKHQYQTLIMFKFNNRATNTCLIRVNKKCLIRKFSFLLILIDR